MMLLPRLVDKRSSGRHLMRRARTRTRKKNGLLRLSDHNNHSKGKERLGGQEVDC
jgi:hypothetical protein